jgi:hypothetical protein
MKICELKINNGYDREKRVLALVNAGYTVTQEGRQKPHTWQSKDYEYFVIVESKDGNT